jgi:hypothetical protein
MRHSTRERSRGGLSAVDQPITVARAVCNRLEPIASAVSCGAGRPLDPATTAVRRRLRQLRSRLAAVRRSCLKREAPSAAPSRAASPSSRSTNSRAWPPSRCAGSLKMEPIPQQPLPGMLRLRISPPCARTAFRAIESPRPRPDRSLRGGRQTPETDRPCSAESRHTRLRSR